MVNMVASRETEQLTVIEPTKCATAAYRPCNSDLSSWLAIVTSY